MSVSVILGPPGTGKTTALLDIVGQEIKAGIPPDRIAFLSFTKRAATEAMDRAQEQFHLAEHELPYFRTLHSLAYTRLGIRREQMIQMHHYKELGRLLGLKITGRVDTDDDSITHVALGDKLLFIENLARVQQVTLEEQFRQVDDDEVTWGELDRGRSGLAQYKRETGLIDFTDLIARFNEMRPCPQLGALIVDEAQDLSSIQWEMVGHLSRSSRHVYFAGDDDQCQPAGTQVLTTDGYKSIEELEPCCDRLVSYDRDGSYIVGRRNGYSFQKSKRKYVGRLVNVSCTDHTTQCTPEHRWLVRWTDTAKQSNYNVVYVMENKHGTAYRIGWCQLFRSDGCLHLTVRANAEKAGKTWIVAVCTTKQDASIQESILAARYGISTAPFQQVNGAQYYTQEALDRIFAAVPGREGAYRLLSDFGLLVDHPLLSRDSEDGFFQRRSTLFKTVAANLLSDLMAVPIDTGEQNPLWSPVTITKTPVQNTDVYSLNVEKHHMYIADSLITCNCIYRWAGADVNRFISLASDNTRVLEKSYRLKSAIYNVATDIARRIKTRRPKDWQPKQLGGMVLHHPNIESVNLSSGEWLLLARHNHQVKEMARHCLDNGLPFSMGGKSPLTEGYVRHIIAWQDLASGRNITGEHAKDLYSLMVADVHYHPANGLLKRLAKVNSVSMDYLRINYGLTDTGQKDWSKILIRIPPHLKRYYQLVLKRGESLTDAPRIRLSTIHGVKGGEADNVVVLTDLSKKTYDGFIKNPDDEHRVFYVAVSRAKEALHIVEPSGQFSYSID